MFTIHLHNLLFYSFHGIHEEEKVVGGWFEISVDIKSDLTQSIDTIADTVNYVDAYHIIKEKMNAPTALLETVAENIVMALYQYDQRIIEIHFSIKKLNPPIQGFAGNVGVSLHKIF